MTANDPATMLESATRPLETALESPLIPGEVESWAREAKTQAQACGDALRSAISNRHASVYGEIKDQDTELMRRIEQLRDEDEAIREAWNEFESHTHTFADEAPSLEPDETGVPEKVTAISDEGLALVIRVRKQELALRTWLGESVDRTRGPVD